MNAFVNTLALKTWNNTRQLVGTEHLKQLISNYAWQAVFLCKYITAPTTSNRFYASDFVYC